MLKDHGASVPGSDRQVDCRRGRLPRRCLRRLFELGGRGRRRREPRDADRRVDRTCWSERPRQRRRQRWQRWSGRSRRRWRQNERPGRRRRDQCRRRWRQWWQRWQWWRQRWQHAAAMAAMADRRRAGGASGGRWRCGCWRLQLALAVPRAARRGRAATAAAAPPGRCGRLHGHCRRRWRCHGEARRPAAQRASVRPPPL